MAEELDTIAAAAVLDMYPATLARWARDEDATCFRWERGRRIWDMAALVAIAPRIWEKRMPNRGRTTTK
jgi:hypothetical protein